MKEISSNQTFDNARSPDAQGATSPPPRTDRVPDTSSPPQAGPLTLGGLPPGDEHLPNAAYVRDWTQTSTLRLLRELTDLAASVAPTIARRANLSHSELRALELLVTSPHGLVEMARQLGVTPAASSAIADKLEARGHVVRRPHDTDGRRTQLVLTDSGREEVLGHLIPMFAGLREVDAGMSEEDRAAVDRFLTGCLEAIRRVL